MPADGAEAAAEVRRLLGLVIAEPERLPALPPGELDLALRLARRARLLGRVAARLDAEGLRDTLPEAAVDQLDGATAMAAARARLARWELDRIARAMRGNDDVPLIAMKGCAYLLLGTPNAAGRVFADVDLMTVEEELENVEAALNTRGWDTATLTPYDDNYYRRWTHELPPLVHREREMEVDLHHNVLPRTARFEPDGRKLVERSREVPGSRYRVLAEEDIVLHAMTHLAAADDLADKLRDLVDIGDLLSHFAARDDAFWARFVERAPELDLERPAYYCLRYLERFLDVRPPAAVRERMAAWGPPKPVGWLMDRLVPRALYPRHPDGHDRLSACARLLLYVRSHWIRMPPWLLAYHLAYKFFVTRLGRRKA